jgi:hypothetical protein
MPPTILPYVQAVKRAAVAETTPRRPGTRQASGQTQAEVVDLKKRRTTTRMLEPPVPQKC